MSVVTLLFAATELDEYIHVPIAFGSFRAFGALPEEFLRFCGGRECVFFVVASNCNHIVVFNRIPAFFKAY